MHGETVKEARADKIPIDKTTTPKLKFSTLCRLNGRRGMAPFLLNRSTR